MQSTRFHGAAAVAVVVSALAASAASAQLANPGFEDPVTTDGPPFVGFWEAFTAGPGSLAGNSTAMPRSGAGHLSLSITDTNDSFAGVFQDVPNLRPGATATFGGYHMTPSSPLDLGTEVRIEWRNSTSNTEVGRTPNLTVLPTGQYAPFTLTGVVPLGADTARVVYAIQTFGPEPTNNGVVYVDDASFIPEPASPLLLTLAGLGLAMRRRRRG